MEESTWVANGLADQSMFDMRRRIVAAILDKKYPIYLILDRSAKLPFEYGISYEKNLYRGIWTIAAHVPEEQYGLVNDVSTRIAHTMYGNECSDGLTRWVVLPDNQFLLSFEYAKKCMEETYAVLDLQRREMEMDDSGSPEKEERD